MISRRLAAASLALAALFAARTPVRAERPLSTGFPRWAAASTLQAEPAAAVQAKPSETGATAGAEEWDSRPVRLPPLFWFEEDPEERSRLLMVSMLYWDISEEDASRRLLLPVFYRWREADRRLLVSLPLVISYRRADYGWTVAGPFYRQSSSETVRTLFIPLYHQKSRRDGGRVTTALPFLFYDYRSHDRSRRDQVSLLGWSRTRPERTVGLTLNYFWREEAGVSLRTLLPVYWQVRSPGRRLDLFGPFYWRRLRPAEAKPPPVIPDYAPAEGPAGAPRDSLGLFPLVGFGWGDRTSHYLFPLYYAARSPDGGAFATLPASRFRRGDQVRGHAGLYYYSHDPDLSVRGVFPVWHRARTADGYEGRSRFLNFYESRENEDYFQTLFPLYGYWSAPEAANLMSWGVWWRRTAEERSGWAYLYHWKRRANGDNTRVMFPLYWHFQRVPDWSVDVIFPVYSRYRDGDSVVTAVPPVIWKRTGDRLTWSLLFLYWSDRGGPKGSTTFVPLFHHNYNPARRMLFSPVSWTRRSAASREGALLVPPAYWYRSLEKKRLLAFPFYWSERTPTKDLRVIPPYYRWRWEKGGAYGLFPLWGRHRGEKEGGGYLLPFYWYTANQRGDGLWIIPPLAMTVSKWGTGTDDPHFRLQYLLLGNVDKSTDSLSHDFFPLYKYVRRKDFRNFWAPRGIALWAWEREGERRKGYIFPYAWRRSPEKEWDLFVPLYFRSRNYETISSTMTSFKVEGSTAVRASDEEEVTVVRGESKGGLTVFFPLYWASGKPSRHFRLFIPLHARYQEPPRRFSAWAPLWVSYDSLRGGRFRMFFPLYWRFLLKPGEPEAGEEPKPYDQKQIVVAGPWYRVDSQKDEKKTRTVGLAPLFAFTRSGTEDRYWEFLGGLFARDVQGGRRRFRLLYFFYTPAKALK